MQTGSSRGSGGYWNEDRVRTDRKGYKHQSYGRWQEDILPVVAPTEKKMTISTVMTIDLKGCSMKKKEIKIYSLNNFKGG